MAEIIGVRFNSAGKAYYFDPDGMKLAIGTMVVVETSRGIEIGKVSIPNREVHEEDIKTPLKKIIRIATDQDKKQFENNKIKEKEAFKKASELILEHKLEMKLIDVEYTFDGSKILFYFTADGRVDFRELVKSLASVFRTRIELRQIGVRDEARQLGSIGICGRFLCCSTFLDDFRSVSIKMAKEQGLSLNPTKISGVCGRLMCCLQYEQVAYDDALKTMPSRGTRVETLDGNGIVIDTATLKQQIRVRLDGVDGHKSETYKVGEFNVIGKDPTVSLEELKKKKEQEALLEAEQALEQSGRGYDMFDDSYGEKDKNENKGKSANRRRRRPINKKPKGGAPQKSQAKKQDKSSNENKTNDTKPKVSKQRYNKPKANNPKNNDNKEGKSQNNKSRYHKTSGKKSSNGGYTNQ